MASIKDVARRAGVSISTVSRVMNQNAPVNEATRQIVEEAMRDLDYIPDKVAQGMRTRRSNLIGMVIPEYKNSFYHEMLHFMEKEGCKQGYRILVSSIREKERTAIDQVRELIGQRLDGIILCTYCGETEFIEYLVEADKKTPIVLLDYMGEDVPLNSVYTNGYQAMTELTEHLLGQGYEQIGYITGLKQFHVANDRIHGFLDVMRRSAKPVLPQWIYEGDYSVESGYLAAQSLMGCQPRPVAIVAASDLMAMGAMNYLLSHGFQVPTEIAVAGFDDLLAGRLLVPSLTTIAQPMQQIARKAIGLISDRRDCPGNKPRRVVLEGRLVVRASTDITKPSSLPIMEGL